jgi:hypothetical protein
MAARSRQDVRLAALAGVHAVVLLAVPAAPVIAFGLWWNSNTISHNFIHRPYFRRRAANALFAAYESVLLGIPQALWRDRHLAHHARTPPSVRLSAELILQTALVLALWTVLVIQAPRRFLVAYLPGYVGGLLLCALHGHFEHAHGTTSHYGRLYNWLTFNDGYHAEHHAHPHAHWTCLPQWRGQARRESAWPAPLRWMETFSLQGLERLVLKSRALQRFVLRVHRRALTPLVGELAAVDRVAIVGGGLFPRTALIMRELLPPARIVVIDASLPNLERGCAIVADSRVEFVHAHFPESGAAVYDLVVIPLSFDGNRRAIYARPPASAVIVHDWLWRKRGRSRIVSIALLKRVNLLTTGLG